MSNLNSTSCVCPFPPAALWCAAIYSTMGTRTSCVPFDCLASPACSSYCFCRVHRISDVPHIPCFDSSSSQTPGRCAASRLVDAAHTACCQLNRIGSSFDVFEAQSLRCTLSARRIPGLRLPLMFPLRSQGLGTGCWLCFTGQVYLLPRI